MFRQLKKKKKYIISLIVSLFTVYIGLWYLTGDIGDEAAKISLFILVIITFGRLAYCENYFLQFLVHSGGPEIILLMS